MSPKFKKEKETCYAIKYAVILEQALPLLSTLSVPKVSQMLEI